MRGVPYEQVVLKLASVLTAVLFCLAQAPLPEARAQGAVARVASVQKLAEKRGAATPFRKVGKGESLAIADSLRTGKRSKAELKFADGSLLRLGQLTSIEIQSAKGVRLTGGRLLFAALRPGRVLAGNGTGEVKGSVAIVALDPDNTAEFTLYSGSMDVIGDRTVTLLPGQSVRVDPQGVLSRVRRAPPFGFQGGELHPDLITSPERGPFTGGEVNERIREGADRTAVDQLIPPILAPGGGFRRGQPFPTPFPTPLPGRTLRAERSGADFSSTAAGSNSRSSWRRSLGMRSPSATARAAAAPVLHLAVAPSASRIALNSVNNAEPDGGASTSASTPESSIEPTGAQVLADFDLDVRPALDHIDDVDRSRGRFGNADARAVGAAADEGASIYGARLRGFGAVGKVYFEATLAPLQLRREGDTVGYSSIATGFLLARDTRGEVRIGRQRFVSGPTQAAFSGSLVRQGGRETMDAIRVTSRPRGGLQFEAAYIFDAFPRNLPFLAADRTAGSQKALYGRVALRQPNFALGLNALKYSSSSIFLPGVPRPPGVPAQPVAASTGTTLDFTFPLARDEVELYGELGRDPFRRRLTTIGLGFPGLYERTNFDAFLEYARLRERAGVPTPPSEVTLRVYRRIGRNVNTITSLSRFGGGQGWGLAIGVAVGGHRNTRYGHLP